MNRELEGLALAFEAVSEAGEGENAKRLEAVLSPEWKRYCNAVPGLNMGDSNALSNWRTRAGSRLSGNFPRYNTLLLAH
jgi:hypothetical protein